MKRLVLIAITAALAGCSSTSQKPPLEIMPDMDRQLRFNPQAENRFFSDGRASRPPVPGTVAVGTLKDDTIPAQNPLPLTAALLERGNERFNIYCAPCHDRVGTGRGIVGQRASWIALSLHDDRIRALSDGEIFETLSFGKRTMPGYRFQVPEQDRWAIVAYVRALQRASRGTLADVPPELRRELR